MLQMVHCLSSHRRPEFLISYAKLLLWLYGLSWSAVGLVGGGKQFTPCGAVFESWKDRGTEHCFWKSLFRAVVRWPRKIYSKQVESASNFLCWIPLYNLPTDDGKQRSKYVPGMKGERGRELQSKHLNHEAQHLIIQILIYFKSHPYIYLILSVHTQHNTWLANKVLNLDLYVHYQYLERELEKTLFSFWYNQSYFSPGLLLITSSI